MSAVSDALARVYRSFHGRLIVPHQTDGVRWMLKREFDGDVKGGIVADEMGLGKTIVTLATIIGNPLSDPTLIIAPKSLVKQWENECRKFTGIQPLIVTHKDLGTLSPIDLTFVKIVITTYDALKCKSPSNALMTTRFGRIILDEAHAIKNKRSLTNVKAMALKGSIRWCLTGTPVTRKKSDFKSLMEFVGVHSSDYKVLREHYTMRRTFEDLSKTCERLRLPPLRLELHETTLETEEEKELYRDLVFEARLRINAYENEGAMEGNTMREVIEVITRLRQASVHPQLVCEGRKLPNWSGNVSKLKDLVHLMSQQPRGSKTLIFTHWNTEAESIASALKEELGIKISRLHGGTSQAARDDVVNLFNTTSSIDALVIHIDVGGVGLNLQGATHIYINSLHWNASNELQAIARAHRIGVDHVVTATRLVVKGTIDEYMLTKQQDKLGFAADVLDDKRIRSLLNAPNATNLREIREFLECTL